MLGRAYFSHGCCSVYCDVISRQNTAFAIRYHVLIKFHSRLKINNTKIKREATMKVLGVLPDENMT